MNTCFVVSAGFPSPAEPWQEAPLDLFLLLVPHPNTTYFVRVKGSSMRALSIHDGDVLVVDRLLEAKQGDIIIAAVHNGCMVKQIQFRSDSILLQSGHPRYPAITVQPEMGFSIWGVVTCVLHPVHKQISQMLQPS